MHWFVALVTLKLAIQYLLLFSKIDITDLLLFQIVVLPAPVLSPQDTSYLIDVPPLIWLQTAHCHLLSAYSQHNRLNVGVYQIPMVKVDSYTYLKYHAHLMALMVMHLKFSTFECFLWSQNIGLPYILSTILSHSHLPLVWCEFLQIFNYVPSITGYVYEQGDGSIPA